MLSFIIFKHGLNTTVETIPTSTKRHVLIVFKTNPHLCCRLSSVTISNAVLAENWKLSKFKARINYLPFEGF